MLSKFSFLLFSFCLIVIFGCSNKIKKTNLFAHQDSLLVDSLTKAYKGSVFYSFDEASSVYADSKNMVASDTLSLATKVFIDSTFFIAKDSIDILMYALVYAKEGKVNKGIMYGKDVAKQSLVSKSDSSLLFIGNYLPLKDQTEIVLKSVRNGKLESKISLDTSFMNGFDLDIVALDSVNLSNTTELIYVNTYYPACGYMSSHYFLDYKSNQFNIVLAEYSWADAPYYTSPNIYLPTKLNAKNLLYQMWRNDIQRDTLNNPLVYKIPDNIKISVGELIYIEHWENKDSVVNGKALLDEYDEPLLFDICTEKKLYKWSGTKLEEVKL